jgi:hypothetical protein
MRYPLRVVLIFVSVACVGICTNVTRSQASTGRAFELVSPIYKGGFGAGRIEAVAPDGDGVMFYSPGAFEGTPAGFANLDSFSYFSIECRLVGQQGPSCHLTRFFLMLLIEMSPLRWTRRWRLVSPVRTVKQRCRKAHRRNSDSTSTGCRYYPSSL